MQSSSSAAPLQLTVQPRWAETPAGKHRQDRGSLELSSQTSCSVTTGFSQRPWVLKFSQKRRQQLGADVKRRARERP